MVKINQTSQSLKPRNPNPKLVRIKTYLLSHVVKRFIFYNKFSHFKIFAFKKDCESSSTINPYGNLKCSNSLKNYWRKRYIFVSQSQEVCSFSMTTKLRVTFQIQGGACFKKTTSLYHSSNYLNRLPFLYFIYDVSTDSSFISSICHTYLRKQIEHFSLTINNCIHEVFFFWNCLAATNLFSYIWMDDASHNWYHAINQSTYVTLRRTSYLESKYQNLIRSTILMSIWIFSHNLLVKTTKILKTKRTKILYDDSLELLYF